MVSSRVGGPWSGDPLPGRRWPIAGRIQAAGARAGRRVSWTRRCRVQPGTLARRPPGDPRWPPPRSPTPTRSSSPAAGSTRRIRSWSPTRPTRIDPAGATYHATEEQYEEAVVGGGRRVRGDAPPAGLRARSRSCARSAPGSPPGARSSARLIALEAGKPIRDALVEVDRAVLTFRLGRRGGRADDRRDDPARPDAGVQWPGRASPGASRSGPVAAISPFNFPLNLAAHKLAPAIAAGCSIVLKPPSKDPLTMLTVGEIVAEAGLPQGAVSILPMTRELGDRMVEDERFKLLTFTGSPSVGWRMKARAGKKKVVLELGGNAGVIVDRDGRPRLGGPADPHRRVHLRRPGLHQRPADVRPRGRLGAVHGALRRGRPGPQARRPARPARRDLGPMVDEAAAPRTQRWVDEAVALGGKLLLGGRGRRRRSSRRRS